MKPIKRKTREYSQFTHDELLRAAFECRKVKEVDVLRGIFEEFKTRVETKRMYGEKPVRTSLKGYLTTGKWLQEITGEKHLSDEDNERSK